jgi:hypothetical protein
MADQPVNKQMWNMLVLQAKSKFGKWPSIPASKWVHEQYVNKGGRFASAGEIAKMKKRGKHGHDKGHDKEKDDK